MRSLNIAFALADTLGQFVGGYGTKRRRPSYATPFMRPWHDPAKVAAAAAKRDRRKDRNVRIADRGGITDGRGMQYPQVRAGAPWATV